MEAADSQIGEPTVNLHSIPNIERYVAQRSKYHDWSVTVCQDNEPAIYLVRRQPTTRLSEFFVRQYVSASCLDRYEGQYLALLHRAICSKTSDQAGWVLEHDAKEVAHITVKPRMRYPGSGSETRLQDEQRSNSDCCRCPEQEIFR